MKSLQAYNLTLDLVAFVHVQQHAWIIVQIHAFDALNLFIACRTLMLCSRNRSVQIHISERQNHSMRAK